MHHRTHKRGELDLPLALDLDEPACGYLWEAHPVVARKDRVRKREPELLIRVVHRKWQELHEPTAVVVPERRERRLKKSVGLEPAVLEVRKGVDSTVIFTAHRVGRRILRQLVAPLPVAAEGGRGFVLDLSGKAHHPPSHRHHTHAVFIAPVASSLVLPR